MVTSVAAQALGLDAEAVARANALHDRAIIVDGSAVVHSPRQRTRVQWDRYTAGGVTATNHTVTDPDLDFVPALAQIADCRRWISDNSDKIMLCLTAADILTAKEKRLGGIIFGPQDADFLGGDLSRLEIMHAVGVRILQLTYQRRNCIGDGCGEPSQGKLSRFGVDVVAEMNRLGIVIDLSHVSEATSFDVIERSTQPVVLSHAHAAAVTPHIRAKSDDLLKAVAHSGGVVAVTSYSTFLKRGGTRPTVADFLRHVTYLVDLLGPDHVGIGLDIDETKTEEEEFAAIARQPDLLAMAHDFSWRDYMAEGLAVAAEFSNATAALLSAGYDDETVLKILGSNFMRVFTKVWGR